MAYKETFDIKSRYSDMKLVVGRQTFGSTGAIDATKTRGNGWSWSRTSAGLYVITLDDLYPELDSVNFTLVQSAATAGHCIQVKDHAVATTGVITILYQENSAGTFAAADIASGSQLGFMIWLRDLRAVS